MKKRKKKNSRNSARCACFQKKKKAKENRRVRKKRTKKKYQERISFFFFALERMKLEYALKYPGKSGGKNSLRENELLDYHRGKGGDGKNLSQ